MPRQVRDASLETRTARSRLKVAHKPYYRLIEPGCHLGYRKLASGPGNWLVRRYMGNGAYSLRNLAQADDYSDPDGRGILSFAQAQERAKIQVRPTEKNGPYSVSMAVADYTKMLAGQGRSPDAIRDVEWRAKAHILPKLGKVEVAALTAPRLRKWRDDLAATAPRLRTKKGQAQKYADVADGVPRARRATANRTWTILRAALNLAFQNDETASDTAWRKVKPFAKVDAARPRWLTIAEAKKLIKACDPDFRLLVRAALATGCRYSELTRLQPGDFNGTTLHIAQSKTGETRDVVLTDEGIALFAAIELPLRKSNGTLWGKSDQSRPMREAVAKNKIEPIGFHGLRHTWASLAIMNGVPANVVALNLGHRGTRMVERFYGHLSADYVADAIKAGAPKFD
jgi:integrase